MKYKWCLRQKVITGHGSESNRLCMECSVLTMTSLSYLSLSGVIEEEETGKFNKKKTVNNYRKTVSFGHTRTIAHVY